MRFPPALPSLRCACGKGADAHGRSDLSHAAPPRGRGPSAVGLHPALCRLLPGRLLHRIPASSAPQCLFQWDDWPSAPLLQPGETQDSCPSTYYSERMRCLNGQAMPATPKWSTIGAFRPSWSKDDPLGWSHENNIPLGNYTIPSNMVILQIHAVIPLLQTWI